MCLVYNKLYGMRNVCLRYFNVYGPAQRYDAYGNVIPIFADRLLHRQPLTIYGDGEQTRDFVNVRDVAAANCLAAFTPEVAGAFNIASETQITINRLAALMQNVAGIHPGVEYAAPRKGDVRHSLADVTAAKEGFGYLTTVPIDAGLAAYWEWVRQNRVTQHRGPRHPAQL
jgi:UDP-glucose 4-epimerase